MIFVYTYQRYQAVVFFLDSNLQQVDMLTSLPFNTEFIFNIGEPHEKTRHEFRFYVDVYDRTTLDKPVDLHRIGSLNFYMNTYYWDAETNTDLAEKIPLLHHTCSPEELKRWPDGEKFITYDYGNYECLDEGQEVRLRRNSVNDYS
jgi:hypothetical protein